MTKEDGDFVIVLSSDLIAEVMEQYFNSKMFVMPVRVADLEVTELGYAFTLGFETELAEKDEQYTLGSVLKSVVTAQQRPEMIDDCVEQGKQLVYIKRDEKGRFVKGE